MNRVSNNITDIEFPYGTVIFSSGPGVEFDTDVNIENGQRIIFGTGTNYPSIYGGAAAAVSQFRKASSTTQSHYWDATATSSETGLLGNDSVGVPTADTAWAQGAFEDVFTNTGGVGTYSGARNWAEISSLPKAELAGYYRNIGNELDRVHAIVTKQELKIHKLERVIQNLNIKNNIQSM